MFQTVHIELAITKNELENNKRLMTYITEKNLHLKKDDSRLRRKIEDRDKIIASSAIEKNQIVLEKERLANELSLVQSQLKDSHSNLQMLQKVHDELATTKRELENNKRQMTDIESKFESKNKTISELETEILRWTENDSQLRQKLEETDRLLQSGQAEMEELRVSQTERIERLQDQVKSLEEKKKKWKKPFENLPKWKIFKPKEIKPKLAAEVG
jgi:chromosome segregation ATPase